MGLRDHAHWAGALRKRRNTSRSPRMGMKSRIRAPCASERYVCRASSSMVCWGTRQTYRSRSEEHTSELQSRSDLVCRLLLEKKKTKKTQRTRCREAPAACRSTYA